eukprot:CAMPEP_0206570868 /NCGR_PEP_ID=MMETSP0325_2-20121206/27293_1 /ASSEMBLY_ACC=CAM_ASM_000347 /TAXON_ID=2866 /ORGANISM="Crypthecodinium cohnii, Strain Seligo" /LENGTH=272 /DNA_ID=CAMNT_0054074737 /DNA_START=94 /DNA_END=912 /DNA_ORIENTATION=+
MGSLNEIDSLLEKLGGSLDDLSDDDDEDDEEDEEAHKKPPKKAKVTKTKKAPKEEEEEPDEEQYDDDLPPMKKSKKKGPKKETPKSKKKNNNKAREEDEEDEEGEAQKVSQKKKKEAAAGVPQVSEGGAIQSKKNKERGSRNGLYACQFDDCKFLHVNPRKLTNKEQAQMLKELPLRAFDEELAKVVQNMNISKCKDFHQRGQCHRAPGQCHFWHLTSASVARWAGFQFWCETCSKGFTSKDQMDDHCKAAPHQRALAQRKRPSKRKWEWAK